MGRLTAGTLRSFVVGGYPISATSGSDPELTIEARGSRALNVQIAGRATSGVSRSNAGGFHFATHFTFYFLCNLVRSKELRKGRIGLQECSGRQSIPSPFLQPRRSLPLPICLPP